MNTIQQGDALIYKDSEFLDFDSVIYVENVTENANGTLVSLSNGQTMFITQVLKKFRKANQDEIDRSEIMSKEIFSKGGKTKRFMKKIKRGGITYGKSHAEGGIPVKNQSTGDMLEVEGGEGIVNKRSMASDKMVKLNGKEMTICEAVSQLNQLEGGVQFSCDDVSDRQFIEAMAKGGELERGVRTEQEHIQVLKDLYAKRITPKQASKRIAKDHLKEDSEYYSKLAKMEGKMADGGTFNVKFDVTKKPDENGFYYIIYTENEKIVPSSKMPQDVGYGQVKNQFFAKRRKYDNSLGLQDAIFIAMKMNESDIKMADGGGIGREETQENNFGVSYKLGDKFILKYMMSPKEGIETSITEILPSGLFFKVDKSSNTFSIKTLHSKGSSFTSGQYLRPLAKTEGKMAKGGKVKNDYNVPSTEDLVDMVANAREKQIKKVKQSGVPIVIGRNDGYYFKTSDSTNYSEQILSSRPSKRKVIEIIESNPNITEVYFQGSIRGGDYIGDVDFDIVDDFAILLWKKPIDINNAIGTTFQWTDTEQDPKNETKQIQLDPRVYMLVKQEDAHIYKDRPTDDKYFYLNSYLEKNGEQSAIRIPKSDFQNLIEEGELETIEVSQALKEQILKPMKTYAKGGEIFDKETEDFLSDLTKKYAKGGEVVADKTETINMKDFEGYADQYNGRKNKFFKANDEYQLLVNEGMDVKNNTTLPQEEKDKLLAELREKAREAKTNLGEKRKDLVDMREVKSPFYAPQLEDGGKIAKTDAKAIDRGDGGTYKIKVKHSYLPSKGIDVFLYIDSLSMLGSLKFSIGTRNLYQANWKAVIDNVLTKHLKLSPSSYQLSVGKKAKSLEVEILFNFPLTSTSFIAVSEDVLKALTSFSYYEKVVLEKDKTTPPPPTEKEDDWNWRFKTEEELRAELGGDLHKLKDGNVFAISMRYLLGKKINETQEAVEAISKINQKTYGGVETFIQKQLGIETPTKDSSESWSISSWMITDKPLAGEEVPPTESKKEITHKDAEDELMRWAKEKTEEKNDNSTRKYQLHHLISYILLNQSNARMSDFTQFIAMAKESRKLEQEILRLSSEKIPIDSFVMKLLINRYSESVKDLKSQIMLFVKYESDIAQELGNIHSHIPYLAELDTFDKDYIIYIK